MNNFEILNIMSKIENFFKTNYFTDIFLVIILLSICFLVRKKLANFFYNRIIFIIKKFSSNIVEESFELFKKPLEIISYIFYFSFLSVYFENFTFVEYLKNVNKSLFSIITFSFLYYLISSFQSFSFFIESYISKEFYVWFKKSFSFIIVFLIVISVLEIWGIEIGPVIAGLGLFGVAVALGAQDLFKNLISGLIILLEKKFQIGDVICLEGEVEGTVEEIGFRSTLIRKFNTELVSTPNFLFSEKKITNYSRRKNRRIHWTLGFEYNSSIDQLKKFTNNLLNFFEKNESFIVNKDYNSVVRLEKFNDSSLDLLVICHTNTSDWNEYLLIQENLAYYIKSLADDLDLSFAYPSRKIYHEDNQLV